MFGKSTLPLAVALTLLSGCADPTYVNETNSSPRGQSKLGLECATKFTKSGHCILITWVKKPTETEKGEFTFRAFNFEGEDNFPVKADLESTPDVLLWMPSMGHGSSPTVVTPLGGGLYRATDVFFIMPGEWQIKFQLKATDKTVSDEAILNYTF